jgi:outer membrane protein
MIKMIKFVKPALFVAALLFGTTHVSAQKIAHIDFAELVRAMPEYTTALNEIESLRKSLENELVEMQTELEEKASKYEREAQQLTDLVRQRRIRELQEMQGKIQNFMQENQEDLQRQQQQLLQPITEKAQKAIEEVSTKANFAYVLDSSQGAGVLFSKGGEDLMPAVKKYLGMDAKPTPVSTEKK